MSFSLASSSSTGTVTVASIASSPPDPSWGANQPSKRSAAEFELDSQDFSGSEPDPKRLQIDHTYQSRLDTNLGFSQNDELAHADQNPDSRPSTPLAFSKPNSQVQQPRSPVRRSLWEVSSSAMPPQAPSNLSEVDDQNPFVARSVLEDTAQTFPQVTQNQNSRANWNPRLPSSMNAPEQHTAMASSIDVPDQQVEGEEDELREEAGLQNDQDNQDFASGIHSVTDIPFKELCRLRVAEIRKQRAIICCDLTVWEGAEYEKHVNDVWGGRYRQWETSSKAFWNIQEENIPAASRTCLDLVRRQAQMLKIVLHRRFPPPEDKNSEAMVSYRHSREKAMLYNQLLILREWTAEWEVLYPATSSQARVPDGSRGGSPSSSGGPPRPPQGGSDPNVPEGGKSTEMGSKGGSGSHDRQHKHSAHQVRDDQNRAPQNHHRVAEAGHMLSNGHAQPSAKLATAVDEVHQQLRAQAVRPNKQSLQAGSLKEQQQRHVGQRQSLWQGHQHQPQIGYGNVAQPQKWQNQLDVGLRAQSPSRLGAARSVSSFAGGSGIVHPTSSAARLTATGIETQQPSTTASVQSVSGRESEQTSNAASVRSVINAGHQQPSSAQAPANAGHQPIAAPNSQIPRPVRKRGAPRRVMFPNAPPADSPLPASALINDEEILDRFPEHLSKSEVMKRFVKNYVGRPGGYATKDMVKKLLAHVNAKDAQGVKDDERKKNLTKWVVKEKDSCNAKLRSEERSIGVSIQTIVAQPTAHVEQSSLTQADAQSLSIEQPQSMDLAGRIDPSEPSQILNHASGQVIAGLGLHQNAKSPLENSHTARSDVDSVNGSFDDSAYGTTGQKSSASDAGSETLGPNAAMNETIQPELVNLNSVDVSFLDAFQDVDYNIDWQGSSRLQGQIYSLQWHSGQSSTIRQRDSYLEESLKADPEWARMLASTI